MARLWNLLSCSIEAHPMQATEQKSRKPPALDVAIQVQLEK